MEKSPRSVLKVIVGILLLLLGLFALLTPLTPGSWLALIGLEMLGLGFLWRWIVSLVKKLLGKNRESPPSA
jgi:sulfite exporter TauE/SafE